MTLLHSLRTVWRSEWQMPQKRISICTSRSVGSRRGIVVRTSGDVALAAEYALALDMDGFSCFVLLQLSDRSFAPVFRGTGPLAP